MSNHWDTIEDALKIARNHFETLEIYGYPEKVQAVDAAIAFVREMRQRPPVPNARVRGVLRKVLRKERITIEMSDIDAAMAWLDSAGAE